MSGVRCGRLLDRTDLSGPGVSRDQAKLDGMAAELRQGGALARGYAADVRTPESLEAALARAAAELGPVAVLQYSPLPSRDHLEPVLELTPELAWEALRFSALGLVHEASSGRCSSRWRRVASEAQPAAGRCRRHPGPLSTSVVSR